MLAVDMNNTIAEVDFTRSEENRAGFPFFLYMEDCNTVFFFFYKNDCG